MIEKLLNKFGYIKIDSTGKIDFSPKDEERLFHDLSGVDGFRDYLDAVSDKDIKRYFVAENKSQQDIIKGGFSRMIYMKSKLDKIL